MGQKKMSLKHFLMFSAYVLLNDVLVITAVTFFDWHFNCWVELMSRQFTSRLLENLILVITEFFCIHRVFRENLFPRLAKHFWVQNRQTDKHLRTGLNRINDKTLFWNIPLFHLSEIPLKWKNIYLITELSF